MAGAASGSGWDIEAIRRHFVFPETGRIVTNNAASTQPPRELLALYQALAPQYENVHRGQSTASQETTRLFEQAYDDIAAFIGAPSRNNVVVTRNTTEAHNAVMYSLMTEFRDGDNVVTTMMEHNSNYVPWHALCRDILPRFGRRVQCRLARFDPATGLLDLEHMATLIDARTKLVCCTGEESARRRAYACGDQRIPATGRRAPFAAAGRRCAARAGQLHRRARARRRLPLLLLPQAARAVRRGRAVRERAPARSVAAVSLWRRHDRGRTGVSGARRIQRPAVEVRRRHAEHPRHDRLGARAARAARPRPDARPAALRRRQRADRSRGGRNRDAPDRHVEPRMHSSGWARCPASVSTVRSMRHVARRWWRSTLPAAIRSHWRRRSTTPGSNRAPAVTAPRWRTTRSGSRPRRAAASASTSTTRSRKSTAPAMRWRHSSSGARHAQCSLRRPSDRSADSLRTWPA
jgi:hypothetical protein